MAQLDALRKIIREEVKAVFQEELAGILIVILLIVYLLKQLNL